MYVVDISRSPTGSAGHIAVPGVLLRRAITTTVAEGNSLFNAFIFLS